MSDSLKSDKIKKKLGGQNMLELSIIGNTVLVHSKIMFDSKFDFEGEHSILWNEQSVISTKPVLMTETIPWNLS